MPRVVVRGGSGGRHTAPWCPRDSLRVSGALQRAAWGGGLGPSLGTETGADSVFQEAPKKCFKKLAQTRQWGAGDLPPPFHAILPQSDIHCLVTSDGTCPVTPTPSPEKAWGPQPSLCHRPVLRSSHVLAHVCACLCVCCRVVKLCASPSPNSGRRGRSYATFGVS
ncbi:hypothetical protein HJG60_011036 [Phyllostomus discolor]|uniref:Uncharacterized protein n=1 Tax=Phyllostomus discolor TaxID=89673 RepID=A0A834ACM2_9CHIR|nr:hypothetical protein HJG60_011036 [Phyllostomus discolor]